jgi:hypothetical protein
MNFTKVGASPNEIEPRVRLTPPSIRLNHAKAARSKHPVLRRSAAKTDQQREDISEEQQCGLTTKLTDCTSRLRTHPPISSASTTNYAGNS